jgi:DNA-binding NarL/FixJ family response regulator
MLQHDDGWRPDRPVRMSRPFETKGLAALTRRRRQVANLVLRGFSNRNIAQKLGVTEGTIKVHLHAIYEKLEVHSRTELTTALSHYRKSKPD